MNFKQAYEDLKTKELLERFPQYDLEWCIRYWHGSHIKYTKGRSAPGCEKNIVTYIQMLGFQAEKIGTTGRRIDNTKVVSDVLGRRRTIGTAKWIPGTGTKGSADISATIHGLKLSIEVKIGKDRQSDNQKKYEASINKAGGVYIIARSEDDFLEKFNRFLELPQVLLMADFNK